MKTNRLKRNVTLIFLFVLAMPTLFAQYGGSAPSWYDGVKVNTHIDRNGPNELAFTPLNPMLSSYANAVSGAIDCSMLDSVELNFTHELGLPTGGYARVEISIDSINFQPVHVSFVNKPLDSLSIDITAKAAYQPAVYVRLIWYANPSPQPTKVGKFWNIRELNLGGKCCTIVIRDRSENFQGAQPCLPLDDFGNALYTKSTQMLNINDVSVDNIFVNVRVEDPYGLVYSLTPADPVEWAPANNGGIQSNNMGSLGPMDELPLHVAFHFLPDLNIANYIIYYEIYFTVPNGGGSYTSYYEYVHTLCEEGGGNYVRFAGTQSDISLKVSPNPVQGMARFSVSGNSASDVSLSLFDLRGVRVIAERTISQQEGGSFSFENIDLSNLKPGMYICWITSADRTKSLKIIKI